MSLTKHCTSCGLNFGMNYFINKDGTESELCKYCLAQEPVKKP